ncbi:hypothetical protein [Kribbella jiaozuonensis]|uniref:Uncharacterized protein n=1 Tax=Kribbella jiaozuonensis TaxID=2575441 RepID=A0A4U3M4X3_9ACTN|nr:hypothetical protein [Kribbella jiaozuonensis]TKK79119.1 hypothetical protein FDA38_11850 [Kribbella jiaozuonensis]TKK83189.1 hypothetical protein FDA38_10805 [Kribbella jiaozuonensis]
MSERKEYYGLAEIADALGLNRQLVTAWRRRRSHGIPDPDGELSSGPIWRGTTIEPWIDVVREQRDAPAQPISPELALKAGRRMLRVAALLLEEPIRLKLLSQALAEARELLPVIDDAADDRLGRAVRQLLSPLRATGDDPGNLQRFRRKVVAELAQLETLVELTADSLPEADSAS